MPSWLVIVLALGGTALINGMVAFILQRTIYKKAEKRDMEEKNRIEQAERDRLDLEKLRAQQERAERIADMKSLLEPMSKKIDNISEQLVATSQGTLASLRNDILTSYYKCCEKGYRNDYDYQNIHDLYNAYCKLNGNSFITDVMHRFDTLPVKETTVPTKVVKRKSNKQILNENNK